MSIHIASGDPSHATFFRGINSLANARRLLALSACLLALSVSLVSAQDRSRYREYRIGDDVQTISGQSGSALPIARIIPHEPVVLQEMEWRPQYFRGAARQADAVARVTFGFYDDQLFRIVVDYDRLRTDGMTEADMVMAFSESYGPPSRRVVASRTIVERAGQGADLLVASWEDAEYSVTLHRMEDSSAFRLIVASTRLTALAEAAGAAGVLLDVHEAPAARSDDVQNGHSTQEKSRLSNKAAFKP